jgi:hypothetical protein
MDGAKTLDGFLHRTFDIRGLGHIGYNRQHFSPFLADLFCSALEICFGTSSNTEQAPFIAQSMRNSLPNTPTSTSDQGDLPLEF